FIIIIIYYFIFFLFFFFFSSRRRHTRCLSDWSSDVCSSDLPELEETNINFNIIFLDNEYNRVYLPLGETWKKLNTCGFKDGSKRSEERRVGKECRYRWSRYQ